MTDLRQPEIYWTSPTAHVPNSKLPVLVYRNVLPADLSVETVTKALETNHWMKGGVFGHYPAHHYHSNTHECYAAISGSTKCVYGIGPLDDQSKGIEFEMKAGDIAVHAPGVAHRNMESSSDYQYVGLYPKVGIPVWPLEQDLAGLWSTLTMARARLSTPMPSARPTKM